MDPVTSSTPAYTIIRVKRKLTETTTTSDDRFTSFKRLRHIGSFASKPDETVLAKNGLLKQMGFETNKKRMRISDLNTEQFAAYVEKLDETGKRVKVEDSTEKVEVLEDSPEKTKEIEDGGDDDLFKIALEQADFDHQNGDKKKEKPQEAAITCNGSILEEQQNHTDQYVYDYYVIMDNLLNFEEPSAEEVVDDIADDDSNDENYRYNDYPDEDELDSGTGESGEESDDEYGYRQYGVEEDDPEYYDGEDDDFCGDFEKKMRLKTMKSGEDEDEEEED